MRLQMSSGGLRRWCHMMGFFIQLNNLSSHLLNE